MSDVPSISITNPITKKNYQLLWRYLKWLLGEGIEFLRKEYIAQNDQTALTRLGAISFYDFILKDNIEAMVKNLVRVVINTGVECIELYDRQKDEVDPDKLDKIIERRYPTYQKFDMTLLHTSHTHPAYAEMEMISILTFRVAVIQATRLLASLQEVQHFDELVRSVFPEKQSCLNSIGAILMMIDQMIDCFEQNLDMINIPVFQPTFSIRDFSYIRKIYEHAQKVIQSELAKIYQETETHE